MEDSGDNGETRKEGNEARREINDRARQYFLILARRAEANPEVAEAVSRILGDRIAENWEPALEAAMQAAESFESAQVHPVIDATIAKSLREKPDLHLVAELYNRIPIDTVSLKQTAFEVFRITLQTIRERNIADQHPSEYITFVLNTVKRQLQMSMLAEAEENTNAVLEVARTHYQHDQRKFRDSLAETLETHAIIASALGRDEEGLQALAEAIELFRAAPAQTRDLARCLNNLSGILKALGDASGALQSSLEAVQLYRSLVAANPRTSRTNFSDGLQASADDPRPDLADALIALSTHQNDAQQTQECLASAQEAFDIFVELFGEFPDQFRHHFGMACFNLGMAKLAAQDGADGVSKMVMAADVYASLAAMHPGAYQPDYAHILGGLAVALAQNGRVPDGLRAAELCVAIYRTLYERNSMKFIGQLRSNLGNLKILYEELGYADKAAAIGDEIIQLPENINPTL
jgi:tetratricopeptide (TPR) repeat protein